MVKETNDILPSEEILIQLIARLTCEKSRLITALGKTLQDNPIKVAKDFGARGQYDHLPGIFEINCGRDGYPTQNTGSGKGCGLKHYQWIPIIYYDCELDLKRAYTLSFCQEDLDFKTANLHQNFFALQLTKTNGEGEEIGGEANEIIQCGTPDSAECEELLIRYSPNNSFPRAIRRHNKKSVYDDDEPWGYTEFKDEIPCMIISDEDYRPAEVARFVMKLIAHDIKETSGQPQ